jgi:hypothetical protein
MSISAGAFEAFERPPKELWFGPPLANYLLWRSKRALTEDTKEFAFAHREIDCMEFP